MTISTRNPTVLVKHSLDNFNTKYENISTCNVREYDIYFHRYSFEYEFILYIFIGRITREILSTRVFFDYIHSLLYYNNSLYIEPSSASVRLFRVQVYVDMR